MSPETRPLGQVAADVIAADVERTQLLGRPLKGTGTVLVQPQRTYPWWIWIGLGVGGLLVLVVGGFVLGFFGGGAPPPSPSPTATPSASPTASPSPTPSASPSPTPSPSPSPSPTPSATPSPSPSPSASPGLIGSVAFFDFDRIEGICALAENFTSLFHFESLAGALTLTQLPDEHITLGTLTPTIAGSGMFSTVGEGDNAGQTYDGTITGTTVSGTHVYTAGGCNDTYSFTGRLYTPFLMPPPLGTPPAGFNFLNPDGLTRQLPIGEPARISIIALQEGYTVEDMLPYRIVMSVGNEMPWDFPINGAAPGGCVNEFQCYGDSPTFAEADWFAPGQQPVLIAYDPSGQPAAVYAPNGFPIDFVPLAP
jgi:hypothetical protein